VPSQKSRLVRAALLLFGSGLSSLIYQVAWMRDLRLVFGFSTAASAAVVAIFLGGQASVAGSSGASRTGPSGLSSSTAGSRSGSPPPPR